MATTDILSTSPIAKRYGTSFDFSSRGSRREICNTPGFVASPIARAACALTISRNRRTSASTGNDSGSADAWIVLSSLTRFGVTNGTTLSEVFL
jgi:hypothetical protein